MKIYLAAAFQRIEEIKKYKLFLESLGHTITSRWLNLSLEDDALVMNRNNNKEITNSNIKRKAICVRRL